MKEISLLPLLPPVQTGVLQRSNNGLAAGTRHHAIVNAVCAVGRAEPGIPTQVVGRALDGGSNAPCRQSGNNLAPAVSRRRCSAAGRPACSIASIVSVRGCGGSVG